MPGHRMAVMPWRSMIGNLSRSRPAKFFHHINRTSENAVAMACCGHSDFKTAPIPDHMLHHRPPRHPGAMCLETPRNHPVQQHIFSGKSAFGIALYACRSVQTGTTKPEPVRFGLRRQVHRKCHFQRHIPSNRVVKRPVRLQTSISRERFRSELHDCAELSTACIRSNPLFLVKAQLDVYFIGSISILPCMYHIDDFGPHRFGPRRPPKRLPRQAFARSQLEGSGLLISATAGATR